jgi:hypothetical protein
MQHIFHGGQQASPQQVWSTGHCGSTTWHVGIAHAPRSHSVWGAQEWPHAPQLRGSFARSAQAPSHVPQAPVAPP